MSGEDRMFRHGSAGGIGGSENTEKRRGKRRDAGRKRAELTQADPHVRAVARESVWLTVAD